MLGASAASSAMALVWNLSGSLLRTAALISPSRPTWAAVTAAYSRLSFRQVLHLLESAMNPRYYDGFGENCNVPARRRPTEDYRGDSCADPTPGGRKLGLGSPQDPRRTSEARLRRLGAERGALSATHSASRRPCQALAGVLTESSRSDRRLRLLHRADSDLQAAVLLLRDRAWAA